MGSFFFVFETIFLIPESKTIMNECRQSSSTNQLPILSPGRGKNSRRLLSPSKSLSSRIPKSPGLSEEAMILQSIKRMSDAQKRDWGVVRSSCGGYHYWCPSDWNCRPGQRPRGGGPGGLVPSLLRVGHSHDNNVGHEFVCVW